MKPVALVVFVVAITCSEILCCEFYQCFTENQDFEMAELGGDMMLLSIWQKSAMLEGGGGLGGLELRGGKSEVPHPLYERLPITVYTGVWFEVEC